MPGLNTRIPKYKKSRETKAEWNNFRKGLNLLLRETELGRDELSKAENIMLAGAGVATGRWGTAKYFSVGSTGTIRGLGQFKSGDTNEFFALSDEGYLSKKDGSSSSVITGQSWPSGSKIRAEQLGGKTYIVSEDVALTSYDGTDLSVFATILPPTGLTATNFSGATGTNIVSYRVTAIGENGGVTTGSDNYLLENVPFDLSTTQIHLSWTAPSAASLSGFEIYRGSPGSERLLAGVPPTVTSYVDNGDPASETILAPVTNTTGGIKSKFIKKYKDRLLVVPTDDPTKLVISGRYPNQFKFSWLDGGGYVYIEPDDGDEIVGIEVQPIADRIVVYKENSSHLVELSLVQIGNFSVLDPTYQPISTAVGCSSQETIATVENDTFYLGREGVYVTGYEPNFLNIIRTNEVSAKIRPYLALLNKTDFDTACALYVDNKYILSFPQRKEMIVYDRERGAWVGPWKLPYGISQMRKYIDGDGTERWVLGSYDSNQVYVFEKSLNSDDGQTITKTMRTNKEYFDDWTLLNNIKFFYILFASITGEVNVNVLIEDRSGRTTTAKSFTISGAEISGRTGWGMNLWGSIPWGSSVGSPVIQSSEITKWGPIFKQARLVQTEITSTSASSNFELLQIKLSASKQSEGSLSSSQRV